ncbi:uncharacterized protein [Dermacentor albipictus]|uniref:uncharacterized protein n=1 Tax=Dermacentor albipictus TaxID=60249 RepID=UPI0038FC596A
MRGWALVAAVLLSAGALPEDDSPATPDYVELELGGEPARNRTRWDSRFVDAEGRFLAKIMATFILSKDLTRSFDYRIAKPALDIAITKVRKLYPHIAFELIGRRGYTSCINNYAGNYAAEEYLGGGVAAFVGPGCSMAVDSVGRLASHWNVPVCTAAGVGAQFEDRTIYGTLVRLALTINALRDAFLQVKMKARSLRALLQLSCFRKMSCEKKKTNESASWAIGRQPGNERRVLRHFGWRHLVVLSDSSQSFFRQLRRALEGLFADPDTGVRAVFRDFDSSRSSVNYTSLLVEGRSYARVFLLAGDGELVQRKIAKWMQCW